MADSGYRIKTGALDQHYIDSALEYPFAKKIDLMRYAIESAELTEQLTATRQRAYEMHERLRDQIDAELLKKAKDARRMGLTTLMKLCEEAESESVKAQVATTLTKDLFPNVSVKKVQTIDDIEMVIYKDSRTRLTMLKAKNSIELLNKKATPRHRAGQTAPDPDRTR